MRWLLTKSQNSFNSGLKLLVPEQNWIKNRQWTIKHLIVDLFFHHYSQTDIINSSQNLSWFLKNGTFIQTDCVSYPAKTGTARPSTCLQFRW